MKRKPKQTLTMIYGECEHEWPADRNRDICPRCGCDAGDEHVIRDDAEHYKFLEPEDLEEPWERWARERLTDDALQS